VSIFDTFVAKRQTLTDFCDHRNLMARLITEHFEHFDLIKAEMKKFSQYGMPREAEPHGSLKDAITHLDRTYWRNSFEHTGLMQLLDAESRKKFDKDLHNKTPEFTLSNVQSTFVQLSQDADKMFEDGVINIFDRLHGRYERHDSFKIDEKIILTYMIEPRYTRGLQLRHGFGEDQINDLDRVFKVLDGKQHKARELSNAMNKAFCEKSNYEDEYLEAKAYKNGNLHIKFNRSDLIDKVNLIIAKRYGNTVGAR